MVTVIETVAWGDTPARAPVASEAVLYLKGGEPFALGFGCPCGRGRSEGNWGGMHTITFADFGGPHQLVSADPLTVSPSIGNHAPCVRGEGRCHFYITDGQVDWRAPL